MATSIPLPFKTQQIPVTPPPELQMFMTGYPLPVPGPYTSQGIPQATARPASNPTLQDKPSQQPPTPHPFLTPTPSNNPTTTPTTTPFPPAASSSAPAPAATAPAIDPRYAAMASRIASYYQQRCQAVAHFQTQRCQAWAGAQRQKCQEMMQAATVIVAWYIRDRIARRRRRRTRAFRRGLAARTAVAGVAGAGAGGAAKGGRVSKGEAVRRWVLGVPSQAGVERKREGEEVRVPPLESGRDRDEVAFDVDREGPVDKDAQLFSVADNLIKSHLARVDVPLLGLVSFEESETESEGEDDFMDYEDYEGGEDEEEEEDYDYEEDEREEAGGDGEEDVHAAARTRLRRGLGGTGEELASASKEAQLGTTPTGSRKRSRSCIS